MKERSILLVGLLCVLSIVGVVPRAVAAGTLNSTRVAVVNDDKSDLQTYYNEVESNYLLMTDPSYDDAALTAEQKEALAAELEKVKTALDNGTGDYAALLAELKAVYEKVPYVEGGKRWWAITIDAVKDGAQMMFECGPTSYRNRFIKAYPESQNGNSVLCDDEGKSKTMIWEFVATGENDAIYTSKPTYYLKDVTSGKYFGVSDALTSLDPGHKRMVDNTDMAFPFCFLSAADISAQEGVSVNVYGNNDAVFIHHSNADGTWFRLSRFGGYKNVYYISTNYYPTNRDWQAWNLYTSETNLNIKEELQQAVEQYCGIDIPAGDAPGYYSKEQVDAYNNAVAKAKGMTEANSRQEIRNAIDSLVAAYNVANNLAPLPLKDGYYRIKSAYSNFTSQGKTMCAFDKGDGYLGWHTMDASLPENVFKITKTDGGWYVQNAATDKYVGVAIDDNKITMTDAPSSIQTFTSQKSAQWKWSNKTTSYTYYVNGSDPGYVGRYYSQGLNAFDSWQFENVDSAWVESVTIGVAKDSLKAYYDVIKANVYPYVDSEKYDATKVEAFQNAYNAAESALIGTEKHTSSELKNLLADLKNTFTALGFAEGGGVKRTTRAKCAEITDGSVIAIEAASSPSLKGYFLKGQTEYRHELYAWVFKSGLDKDGAWIVEKSPLLDKKNGKPTFYLKQQSTGLYIGKNGTGTDAYQTRALVATTDSAYNFSLSTAIEAGCTTYYGQKNWDENSITFQYANSADHAMNLSNYPGSPTFVWLFEGSTDVIAWNVYNVEVSTDLYDEFEKTMARCANFQPETTGGYGFYDPELVKAYNKAYEAAKAVTTDNSRLEIRNAIDSLDKAYNNIISTGLSPVSSGYFYITNRSEAYSTANGSYAALAVENDSVVSKNFEADSYESVYHVTGNQGKWYVQSLATDKYLTSKDGNSLVASETKDKTFAMNLLGLYQASISLSNGEGFFAITSDINGNVTATAESETDGAAWTFVRVGDEKLAEILKHRSSDKLAALVENASAYSENLGKGKYDTDKENAFNTSYESAKNALENTSSSKEDFDAAYNSLFSAIDSLKASRIYEENSPLENLAKYVASIKANIPHISAKYYDAAAVDSLATAWAEATVALDKENLDSAGYVNALDNLRKAYDSVGYVYGGYFPRITPDQLFDGDIIMLEAASSQYNLGMYMKQPAEGNTNDIQYTSGRDSRSAWKLVDAGKPDKINSKTTYYLQNVETGQYVGYGNNYKTKTMVTSLEKAMNFSILTTKDITFTGYLDGTTGSDENSVTFQFAYSDKDFVWLGNFIAYGTGVYYVTTNSWKHVIAWNVYSGKFEDDIVGEYNEAMNTYRTFRVESNDSPGSYSADVAKSYADALAYANAAEGSDARLDYRLAIDSIANMYKLVNNSNANEISEGTYYLLSNFSSFEDAGLAMGVYAKDASLKWREIDFNSKEFMYSFTKGNNGGWIVKNLSTGKYVGNYNGTAVALIDNSSVEQKFAYIGGGEFMWSNAKSDNTYYPDNYSGDNGNIKTGSAHNTYRGVDAWQLIRVPQEVLDSMEVANSAKLMNRTLVVTGKTKINWIKAQARNVGQLNIMAIDTRNAELDEDVTYEALSKVSSNANCLYYVADSSRISGNNVVKQGVCEALQLVDAPFYCPEPFVAKNASYSLNPAYATKTGGWQTIAVPFEVGSVKASGSGDIAMETVNASGNIFVREFTGIEDSLINFSKLAEPKLAANTPYALAVPGEEFGNRSLANETLTFEGSDVAIDSLSSDAGVKQGNYSFVPTYENSPVSKAWILNYEGNGFESWTNGSPLCFRGYFTSVDSAAYAQDAFVFSIDTDESAGSKKLLRVVGLSFDSEITDIEHVEKSAAEIQVTKGGISVNVATPTKITVFDSEGKLIYQDTVAGSKNISLSKGIYVVNNRKVLVNK